MAVDALLACIQANCVRSSADEETERGLLARACPLYNTDLRVYTFDDTFF